MILCEGYTDVIALHQAGMRNAVGLMGTALTAEQVGELARMAQTVLLALDADSAGQEAMLRASQLGGETHSSSCGSCRCRRGPTRPSWSSATGRRRCAAAVGESVPFVRFRVERVLAAAITRAPRAATA